MDTFKLEIITPDTAYPPRDVVSLDVPAEKGRLAILAHHEPFVCTITGGKIVIRNSVDALEDSNQKKAGERESWTTGPGTMVVTADMVTILARNIRPTGPRSSQ